MEKMGNQLFQTPGFSYLHFLYSDGLGKKLVFKMFSECTFNG